MLSIPRRTLLVVWCVLGAAVLAAETRGPLATFFIEDAPGRFVAESSGVHAVFSKDGV
jgi:hypothetical protein